MHICEDLNQRLDELKKQLAELDSLAQAVTDADSKQDLESLAVDEKLNGAASLLVEKRKELEGMKGNFEEFKEEVLKYIGAKEEDWSDFKCKYGKETGCLQEIACRPNTRFKLVKEIDLSYFPELTLAGFLHANTNRVLGGAKLAQLYLGGCTSLDATQELNDKPELLIASFCNSNVSRVLGGLNLQQLNVSKCQNLDRNQDLSDKPRLLIANFDGSNVETAIGGAELQKLFMNGCSQLAVAQDLSDKPKLADARFGNSKVQVILLSEEQYSRYQSGKLSIEKDDGVKIKIKD